MSEETGVAETKVPVALEAAIDRKIHEAVKFEEERRFRQLKWVGVIFGIVGTGTLSAIATLYVDNAIESRSLKLADQAALFRVQAMAAKFEGKAGFSREEAANVVRVLRRISTNRESRESPEVVAALVTVVDRFVSAGQGANVDDIVDMYTAELRQSGVATENLIHHYGQEINSVSPGLKLSWQPDSIKRFETFERAAVQHNVEELALAYRTLHEFEKGGSKPSPNVDSLINRAAGLSAKGDRQRYFRELLIRTRSQNWVRKPTSESAELERRTRAFFAAYADSFKAQSLILLKVAEVGQKGCPEDECDNLAKELVDAYVSFDNKERKPRPL